jgi:hypothetical protein
MKNRQLRKLNDKQRKELNDVRNNVDVEKA